MSSSIFRMIEHTLECNHIREYPFATMHTQEEVLHLAIKQYIPLDNLQSQPGDVTIIAAHACGFPKELYEPLWDEIHHRSKSHGFRIRNIWIADISNQGASGILNENILGNEPSWMDHSRDLLHMINHFRAEMPLPLIGVGHSMGGAQLVNLAYMHPRLLHTIVLMDPVIAPFSGAGPPGEPNVASASASRRDLWPSINEATSSFSKSKFYQKWDRRVLERWLKFGIRETPTKLYPEGDKGNTSLYGSRAVTLATTKHQEVFTYLRRNYAPGPNVVDRELTPDLDLEPPIHWPLYRPEQVTTFKRLPTLRPSVLYIFGELSDMSTPKFIQQKMDSTGYGVGGSGGVKEGRVDQVTLKGIGHLVAMEAVEQCADAAAPWIGKELRRWRKEAKRFEEWKKLSDREKTVMSEEWLNLLNMYKAKI